MLSFVDGIVNLLSETVIDNRLSDSDKKISVISWNQLI